MGGAPNSLGKQAPGGQGQPGGMNKQGMQTNSSSMKKGQKPGKKPTKRSTKKIKKGSLKKGTGQMGMGGMQSGVLYDLSSIY